MTGGGWEDWTWDETLFAGAAPHYVRGRLPYAEGLADALAAALGLDGRGQLLDVGCGPGVVALLLADRYAEVVGLDPDPGMIAEARRQAASRGVANARWIEGRAEGLPAGIGGIRTATFAASFHWMDRPAVAAVVRGMLDEGGTAVQVDAPAYRQDALQAESHAAPLPFPAPPDAAIDELVHRYLGPDRRAGRGIRNTSPAGEDEIFVAAGYAPAESLVVPDGRVIVRDADDVVAQRLSSSSSAPHLFGDRLASFEADLRALLRDASPDGRFAVRLPANVLRIWRLP